MAREQHATEARGAEHAVSRLPYLERTVARLTRRLECWAPLPPGARVLDVGAAQGATVVAFIRAGFDALGVEPWQPAIDESREVARRTGTKLEIVKGSAERLPFPDSSFDLVHAQSVIEHVEDVSAAFAEASRVLRPGGRFYFQTASAMSPRQFEIARFPAFSWYPRPIKLRIMHWAVRNRPHLVGHTTAPAINWFTPWGAQRQLTAAGFDVVVDRWRTRRLDEFRGWQRPAFRVMRANPALRLLGDVIVPNTAYLALK